MSNIWQNITIALGLKAVFLVTTVIGVTGLWPAILADTGATVLVTANAMRLLGVERIEAGRGLVPVNIPRRQEQAFLAIGCFHPNTEACQASSVRP
jgi:hypothetical protein